MERGSSTGAKAHFSGIDRRPRDLRRGLGRGDARRCTRSRCSNALGRCEWRESPEGSQRSRSAKAGSQATLRSAQTGLLAGSVTVISPDLSKVAPLFLVDARGMLRGEVAAFVRGRRAIGEFLGHRHRHRLRERHARIPPISRARHATSSARPRSTEISRSASCRAGGLTIVSRHRHRYAARHVDADEHRREAR